MEEEKKNKKNFFHNVAFIDWESNLQWSIAEGKHNAESSTTLSGQSTLSARLGVPFHQKGCLSASWCCIFFVADKGLQS